MKPVRSFARWFVAAGACALAALAAASAQAEVNPDVLAAEAERVAVVERACASFVAIFAAGGQGGGSGVVISADGYALSNYHVTSGAGAGMKCGMADGRLYDAVIVGIDPTGDVALIKLFGRDDFPAAPLADSDQVRMADWCFAVGNPFLLAADFHPTVSYGIVSGTHRYQYPSGTLLEYADCIQADAAINPGNSGGPLFNAQGEVIGINGRGSFEKRGRVNVGVGYAISINQIKNFLGGLMSGRIVDHASLGATVATGPEGRVIVSDILDLSDAYRRGLRYGDEVVSFAGRPIRTVNAFKNVLGIFPKHWRVPLVYRRAGQTHEVLVRLAGVHRTGELEALLEQSQGPIEPPGPPPDRPQPGQPQPDRPQPGQPQPDQPIPDGPQPPPDGQPRPPAPGAAPAHAQRPLTEIVQQHYESRSGYANYHFNREAQERIWRRLVDQGSFAGLGALAIACELEGAGPVQFVVGPTNVTGEFPNGNVSLVAGDDLSLNLDPPGSGGLLAALYLWRRLLVEGIDRYGQVYYLGTLPAPGRDGLVDCLVGVHGGVECHFLTDPASGQLVGLALDADDELDPCELVFADYREAEGRFVPGRITVRRGDHVYGAFTVTSFQAQPGEGT